MFVFFFRGLFAKLIDLFEFREHKYPELDIQQKTEINIYIYRFNKFSFSFNIFTTQPKESDGFLPN